ncbi:DUF4168 domain-containing protein [Almyronema epifaneia]|uniref:DUF4168 domain-containing protein n=1 Tax=Almyronema epifaneia S1 TaxID=2991925 RepID=A0ABW6IAZ7_9CYAN
MSQLQHFKHLKSLNQRFLGLLLSIALLLPMSPAWAVASISPEPATLAVPAVSELGLTANDISSEKVSQFVQAYLQVVELIDQRENELQSAETESETLQLQQEIQTEAFSLITQAGLTQPEYWQLLGLANSDMEFRERILAQLEEATSS